MKRKNDYRLIIGFLIFVGMLIMPPAVCFLSWYGALNWSAEWEALPKIAMFIAMIGLTMTGLGIWIVNMINMIEA